MSPPVLATLQERILDGCKAAGLAAGKMPTDHELADVAAEERKHERAPAEYTPGSYPPQRGPPQGLDPTDGGGFRLLRGGHVRAETDLRTPAPRAVSRYATRPASSVSKPGALARAAGR